jgi:radical SAM superfamily enzyme YgiQ (UPF0313 family)
MKYEEPVFRPPSEANSLILQATIGCSHNRCGFCGMYKTKRFRAREFSVLRRDILEAGERWPETRRIFLADGDAFALSAKELIRILDLLNESFPQLSRVGAYINASNVLSKSDDELKSLSERRLKIGYLGLESGNEEILAEMKKGATADQMVEAVRRCQESGIKMSVMVLTGLGGQGRSRQHSEDTAIVLNRMNPRYLSLLAVMPVEGTLLGNRIQRDEFTELTPGESLLEMKGIIERLDLKGTIFRSNHASNYLALSGRLPQDKGRLLKEIEDSLAGKKGLREEWERGL